MQLICPYHLLGFRDSHATASVATARLEFLLILSLPPWVFDGFFVSTLRSSRGYEASVSYDLRITVASGFRSLTSEESDKIWLVKFSVLDLEKSSHRNFTSERTQERRSLWAPGTTILEQQNKFILIRFVEIIIWQSRAGFTLPFKVLFKRPGSLHGTVCLECRCLFLYFTPHKVKSWGTQRYLHYKFWPNTCTLNLVFIIHSGHWLGRSPPEFVQLHFLLLVHISPQYFLPVPASFN